MRIGLVHFIEVERKHFFFVFVFLFFFVKLGFLIKLFWASYEELWFLLTGRYGNFLSIMVFIDLHT